MLHLTLIWNQNELSPSSGGVRTRAAAQIHQEIVLGDGRTQNIWFLKPKNIIYMLVNPNATRVRVIKNYCYIHIVYTFLKMTFQNLVFHCIPLLARRRRRQTVFFIAYSNFLSFLMLPDMISGLILLKYRIYTPQNFFQTAYTQNCIYTFFRRKTAYRCQILGTLKTFKKT